MLHSEKHSTYIYLIKSQPQRVDNRQKSYHNLAFISLNCAALLVRHSEKMPSHTQLTSDLLHVGGHSVGGSLALIGWHKARE